MSPMRLLLLPACVASCVIAVASQQQTLAPERGAAGTALALRRLTTAGTLLMATAHPDDENNALLAQVAWGRGMRAVLATATRGDGGQNEIGPELSDALAILRTEELLAAHQFDGAEQYFTRAIDFGYSFSLDETMEKWGRAEIVGDYVRLIRMTRPHVIVAMRPDGTAGGLHHQASALLARDAFRAAGDPSQYPGQIAEGLHPWQPKKFYFTASFGFRGEPPPAAPGHIVAVDVSGFDPVLGWTYVDIASRARSMHKCQGMPQLLTLPGAAVFGSAVRYRLEDTVLAAQKETQESDLFDGIDTSIAGIGGEAAPRAVGEGLATIQRHAVAARARFEAGSSAAALEELLAGLTAVRATRADVRTWRPAEAPMWRPAEAPMWRPALAGPSADALGAEIDFRLAQKEQQFQDAALRVNGVRLEALADDALVTPGQAVKLNAIVASYGAPLTVKGVAFAGFAAPMPCQAGSARPDTAYTCAVDGRIAENEKLTTPYWKKPAGAARYDVDPDVPFGGPFTPTPFRATFDLDIAGVPIAATLPVQARDEGNIFSGEKRMDLQVVPAWSVRVSPEMAVLPWGQGPRTRELRVTVANGTRGAVEGRVRVIAPAGWRVSPAFAPLGFAREDEARTERFSISPPAGVKPGEYRIQAVAESGGRAFDRGYQVIEYPHIRRRHLVVAAETVVKVVDVKVAPDLQVGYVMGVGDQVPAAIEQLGVTPYLIGSDELAWGDLSRYHTIVTGVRAYERRADLRANNGRLLEFARAGGTVIVQYNKFEFNDAQYGPFPAKVGSGRITDEHAPVRVLQPGHPVFNVPNAIGDAAWRGWVQERGLYFLGDRDPAYVDLLETEDTFEHNKGPKRGALVEARVGKGRWIYLGLGLWRQLPAGTEGAYQVLANLLSLGQK